MSKKKSSLKRGAETKTITEEVKRKISILAVDTISNKRTRYVIDK